MNSADNNQVKNDFTGKNFDSLALPGIDNGNDEGGNSLPMTQEMPGIKVKSGWRSSQGIMTAAFIIASFVLGLFGYHYSVGQMQDWADRLYNLGIILGPIAAIIPVLQTYINSRGKMHSNSINATAAINSAIVRANSQVSAAINGSKMITGELVSSELIGGRSNEDYFGRVGETKRFDSDTILAKIDEISVTLEKIRNYYETPRKVVNSFIKPETETEEKGE